MTAVTDMGHEQIMIIGDAGIPVGPPAIRIDLAITEDLPSIRQILELSLIHIFSSSRPASSM